MAEIIKTSGRSLYDMVHNLDINGNALKTAEVLQRACPMLQDAPVVAANNILTHKVSIRTSLPKPEVKRLNQGVGGAFGGRENREFGLKIYQSLPWIDKKEFEFAKHPDDIRQSNMESVIQGWGQGLEGDFLYDNIAANGADSINGIATYAATIDGKRVVDAYVSGDATTDLTSIYFVAWDEAMGAFAIVPQTDTLGVQFEVLGDEVMQDPADPAKSLVVERYKVEASLGFGVKDVRAVARIANIDLTQITDSTKYTNLPKLIMTTLNQFPAYLRSKVVMYMPKEVSLGLQLAANDKSNASFVYGSTELFADKVPTFNGVPIRESEMISLHESKLS